MTGRPWLSPGPPPWADQFPHWGTPPPIPRRPSRLARVLAGVALVGLLIVTDPRRAVRAWWEPIEEFRRDGR